MAARRCTNCVYSCCDPELWLRAVSLNEPLLVQCANHPWWPGQMHDVPGIACRNYRRKPAVPKGDVRLIPVGDGYCAYVDAAEYEWLSRWTWHLCSGYAVRMKKRKTIYMHREIVQPPDGMIVDHKNRNKLDNTRDNLRVCTHRENACNRGKRRGTRSRFIGVGYSKRDRKWYANLVFKGKSIWLGYFDEEVEAARAYDQAAVEHFGEFARLNFPEEWPPERRREVCAKSPKPARKGRRKR